MLMSFVLVVRATFKCLGLTTKMCHWLMQMQHVCICKWKLISINCYIVPFLKRHLNHMPAELNRETFVLCSLYFGTFPSSYPLYLAPVPLFGRKWCSFVVWMSWKVLRVIMRKYLCHKVTIGKISGNKAQGKNRLSIFTPPVNPLCTICRLGRIWEP